MTIGHALRKKRALWALSWGLDLAKKQTVAPSAIVPKPRARGRVTHLAAMIVDDGINDINDTLSKSKERRVGCRTVDT